MKKMRLKGLMICICLMVASLGFAQSGRTSEKIAFIDSLFIQGEDEGAFPGSAIAYHSSDTSWIASYGTRMWGTKDSIMSTTLFQLGSVGKVMTAIAVMQQVEEGRLGLNEDIRKYLPWIDTKGLVTLTDLLTHSAGLNDKNVGYLVNDSLALKPLELHLMNELPLFYQESGLEINYSNYSYALAGHMVEVVTDIPFQKYVQKQIFEPLGMYETFVGFDFAYQTKLNYALGHVVSSSGFEVREEYARHVLPAGSLISSAMDMCAFIRAMTQKDTLLLNASSWQMLFSRQFSNHKKLGGYSIGLEEQTIGDQTYWAKGGMLMGYLSQIVILPDSSAFFIAVNSNDDSFLEEFHNAFLNEFYLKDTLDVSEEQLPDLSIYAGEYRNGRYDREGIENIISLFRGAFEIWEGSEGLLAYHNGEMHTYQYAGSGVFYNVTNPNQKLVFRMDESGRIERLYRNINIGGLAIPATFEKTDWYNSPTFINEYYGFIPLFVLSYSICLLFVMLVNLIRKRYPKFWKWDMLPGLYYLVAAVGVGSLVLHIIKVFMPLVKSPVDFLFGLPAEFIQYNQVAWVMVLTSIIMLMLSAVAIWKQKGSVLSRVLFFLVAVCLSIHTHFLYVWNFI